MRRIRNKFKKPKRPWDAAQIAENKGLIKEYGLRRKKEIYIAQEILRNFRRRARDLTAIKDKEKEKMLLDKLVKFNLLNKEMGLDDVLALTVNDVLERRLQTIVFRKGLAKTASQARQFIVHGRINVDGRKTVFPSYLVNTGEESKISIIGARAKK
jgi:small subunit ribosomal protein S4